MSYPDLNKRKKVLLLLLSALIAGMLFSVWADDSLSFIEKYKPEIHGTVRAKYEYEPPIRKGRFEVRNARLGVEGKVIPIVRYKAEIDLSDEGSLQSMRIDRRTFNISQTVPS